jgi:hypothetical protein
MVGHPCMDTANRTNTRTTASATLNRNPTRSYPSVPGLVPREWLRVTDAPAPSCVGSRRSRCSVEGGVQAKVEEGVSSQLARAERVPHSS